MLLDQIQVQLSAAQKARDSVVVETLRFLLGAIFNLQIEKYPGGSREQLTDADVLSVISKQVKTHKESIEMFQKANRSDLVAREQAELKILETYLPAQLSQDEVKAKVSEIKEKNPGADFPTLMKLVMAELRGQADGAVVSKMVKDTLN